MYPILFKIGRFELHSYGVMLALAFVVGVWLSAHRARKRGLDPSYIMDLATIIILSAIVGSRAMYVAFHLDEFRGHWTDTFNPFQSTGQIGLAGLTFLGGLILALITSYAYVRWRKLSFLQLADVVMPALALGLFFGRIGCFLNGCCFGIPASCSICVVFPPESPAGATFPGLAIYPTQLISSAYGLVIFLALLLLERYQRFDGYLFYWGLVLYGLARFGIDFIRYYEPSMVALHLGEVRFSVNQVICALLIIYGATMLGIKSRKVTEKVEG